MPNWCSNEEIIQGPITEIKSLHKKLTEWTSKDYARNDFGHGWIGNIVIGAGFSRHDNDPVNGLPCRGNIEESFQTANGERKTGFFMLDGDTIRFFSATAWRPFPETWIKILEKYAPHCKYFFMSEEPGTELYVSNDTEHNFFQEEFYVDVTYFNESAIPEKYNKIFTESSYDWDEEELVSAMQDITGSKETDFNKLLEQFDLQKKKDLARNGYIAINKIRYEKIE